MIEVLYPRHYGNREKFIKQAHLPTSAEQKLVFDANICQFISQALSKSPYFLNAKSLFDENVHLTLDVIPFVYDDLSKKEQLQVIAESRLHAITAMLNYLQDFINADDVSLSKKPQFLDITSHATAMLKDISNLKNVKADEALSFIEHDLSIWYTDFIQLALTLDNYLTEKV